MNLSERIKEFRKAEGLTQEELAQKLFVSRQAVSKWEQSRGYPDLGSLSKLSKLMNISVGGLLSDEDTKTISVGTSKTVAKTNAVLLVFAVIMAVLLVLMSGFMLFNAKLQTANANRALVGFYIDVDPTVGEIAVDDLNTVDIYLFYCEAKPDPDSYFCMRNITPNSHAFDKKYNENSDKISTVSVPIYLDKEAIKTANYDFYKVYLTADGRIFEKVGTLDKAQLLDEKSKGKLTYSFLDDPNAAVQMNFSVTFQLVDAVSADFVRVMQYDSGKNKIGDELVDMKKGFYTTLVSLANLIDRNGNKISSLEFSFTPTFAIRSEASYWESFAVLRNGSEMRLESYTIKSSPYGNQLDYVLFLSGKHGYAIKTPMSFIVPGGCQILPN